MRAPAPGAIEVPFGKVVNPRFKTVTVHNGVELGKRDFMG